MYSNLDLLLYEICDSNVESSVSCCCRVRRLQTSAPIAQHMHMVHTSVTNMTQNAVMEDDVSSDGIEVGFNEGNGLGTVDGESDGMLDGMLE